MGFIINHTKILFEDYKGLSAYSSEFPIVIDIIAFLDKWYDHLDDSIEIMTSGSTGVPKKIRHTKKAMIASALKSAQYFGFKKGDTALLALPAKYIAGKMMIVRAMVSEMQLIIKEPCSVPFSNDKYDPSHIDFAPLTPYQLIKSYKAQRQKLSKVRKILLGGAPVTQACRDIAGSMSNEIYHGFGMTETLTHIAVTKLGRLTNSITYKALQGIRFTTGVERNLIITADHIPTAIETNDIVNLINAQEFEWLGRSDNVVNSGGIKLHPESIESKIGQHIRERYFLIGEESRDLGHQLVMVIESEVKDTKPIINILKNRLNKYETPKKVYFLPQFLETPTGKIKRLDSFAQITGNK